MSKKLTVEDLINAVDSSALTSRPLSEWRPVLAEECQVYVFAESYLAKRFDQIHYKFCEKLEAKDILIDNLYALLRYKYFPKQNEEIDERITKIVNSFTANLKTTLKKVSFDKSSDSQVVNMLPNYCCAFRNGVYNFKDNKWYFKYEKITLSNLSSSIYLYSNEHIILWYLDYDFEPLPFKLTDISITQFIDLMRDMTKTNRNYCFELLYNMSHDSLDKFSLPRFNHLCEILGYTILQSFSQFFVLLIGSGQNGKNSLFDGCFTNRVIPRPSANDMESIETDRFITGSLENKAQNIFLESSAKTYAESKMIKALTGSMYQTIEQKGVSKYSGVINCKYIFAANDQDKIKFKDNTIGFRRRINMFEIGYRWDSEKRFLKKGDYYDTSFSDTLSEITSDVLNTTTFVYFAMYGILSATENFKKNFQFTTNDWNFRYADIDIDMRDKVEAVTSKQIYSYLTAGSGKEEEGKNMMYDMSKKQLITSNTFDELGLRGYSDFLKFLQSQELFSAYFAENDVYLSVRTLQNIIKDRSTPINFTQSLKKIYGLSKLENLYANKPYIKCNFVRDRLKIVTY